MANKPAKSQENLSTKQKAAAARAEAEAAEKRRERMIRTIAAIAVIVVAAGLVAIGVFGNKKKNEAAAPTAPDASASAPKGVSSDTWGVKFGPGWTAANADKLPTLELWEDFQCPACGQLEQQAGEHITKAAAEGKYKLMFRPATFLDARLPQSNKSSERATAAWGCAVDAGKTAEYHAGVFAVQPETEGTGYSEETLLKVGKDVGITGDAYTTFEKCVKDGTYLKWAANSQQKFVDAAVPGTPAGFLNGKELPASDIADQAKFDKAIADATKQ